MGNEADATRDVQNPNAGSEAGTVRSEPVGAEPVAAGQWPAELVPEDLLPAEGAAAMPRDGAVAASPVSIEAFTTDRDVACPGCQYNLRGAAGPNCPECGLRLEVGLVAARRGVWASGVVLAVLLALSWVLVATGMNAARAGRQIVGQARAAAMLAASPRIVINSSSSTFSIRSSISGSFTVGGGGQSRVTQMNPDGSMTTTVTKRDGSQTVTTTLPNGTVINGPAGAGGGAAAPAYLWAAVAPAEWGTMWWWGSLSVLSMLGLLVACGLLLRCGGEWGARWTKLMVAWAGVVFVCYGGYHVVTFGLEVATW